MHKLEFPEFPDMMVLMSFGGINFGRNP